MAKITVHREGYKRKSYTRSDGTHVAAARVPPTTFKIEDRGAPGHGKKVFEISRPGEMTTIARKMGYERPTDIPDSKLSDFARALAVLHGEKTARGMIQAQIVLRKRETGPVVEKFRKLKRAFERLYGGSDR